jgi:ATP-dependent exoDNAse (exonuclease V) alpha subunit
MEIFLIIIGMVIVICIVVSVTHDRERRRLKRLSKTLNDNSSLETIRQYKQPQKAEYEHTVDTSVLDKEQKKLFEIMEESNENMYITGRAGTGKSFLLQFFKENTQKEIAVVAPTGVAALNVGGQTLHSFFAIDFDIQDPSNREKMTVSYKKREILKAVDAIVIDEVSMVSADIMESISRKLQIANDNDLPFGGKQIVMFGDLYQLPPVITSGQVRRYLEDTYGSIFFFAAPSVGAMNLHIYELSENHRQKNKEFLDVLNSVRTGDVNAQQLEALNSRVVDDIEKIKGKYILLATTNSVVSRVNHHQLSKIEKPEYIYEANVLGSITQSSFPTDKELKLKVGAQIMMLVNDNTDQTSPDIKKGRRWVNGTLGIITRLEEDAVFVTINGVEHQIDRYTWQKKQYEYDAYTKKLESEVVAEFTQYPIRLAWAITIHKAQGQTYQSVMIDVDNGAFENGQTYVALSRCASMSRLYLKSPLSTSDIKVSQEIKGFMRKQEL